MKITNKESVKELINKMIEESIEIQLYDNINENAIISIEDVDGEGFTTYTVRWEDTVNGITGIYRLYPEELVSLIWKNRKFVNNQI